MSAKFCYYLFFVIHQNVAFYLRLFFLFTPYNALLKIEIFLCTGHYLIHYAISFTHAMLSIVRCFSHGSLLTHFPIIICYQCVAQLKLPTTSCAVMYYILAFILRLFYQIPCFFTPLIYSKYTSSLIFNNYLLFILHFVTTSNRCKYNRYFSKLTRALVRGNNLCYTQLLALVFLWIAS